MKSNARILVIDDDANLRKTLADILRIKGYEVVSAADGAAGIAEAQRDFVNVALIDLKLPDITGIDLMTKIRASSPLTEAIILTGHASLDTAIEATNKGAFSYLLKPYDIEKLLRHIHRALDRQLGQQEILRLASFPKLNPDPVIELDSTGKVIYLNPAAEMLFPDLVALGLKHPVLNNLQDLLSSFGDGEHRETVREVRLASAMYEQRIHYVRESNLIRVTALDITVRKRQEEKIEKLNTLLLILREISQCLLTVESEATLFQQVCESLKKLEDIVVVWIVRNEPQLEVAPVASAGIAATDLSLLQVRWEDVERGVGFIGSAIQQRTPVVIQDVGSDVQLAAWQEVIQRLSIKSAIAVPINGGDEIIATLSVFSCKQDAFNEEIVRFLDKVAGDTAIGVRTLRLDQNLHATLDNLRKSMNSTVEAIARMVELRDPYTAGHERRVAQLASAIGKEMGLPERQIEGLYVIGHLHDIGKIAVPVEILSKPTRLTELELAMVRTHAQAGYDILKDLDFPWPVAQAVLQHHERLDGSGYPQGLVEQDIILEARVLMVADVVEAMASHRPYRASLGTDAALHEITTQSGLIYDAEVVDACIRLFSAKSIEALLT